MRFYNPIRLLIRIRLNSLEDKIVLPRFKYKAVKRTRQTAGEQTQDADERHPNVITDGGYDVSQYCVVGLLFRFLRRHGR